MNKIPEGVYLINKDGLQIKDIVDYNDAEICIVSKDMRAVDCSVGVYCKNDMPEYIPNMKGVYCLKQDDEFGWLTWFNITNAIQILKLSNLIDYI